MYRFRVVAVIESPSLGDMLGALQTSGCIVQQCDVLTEEVVVGQAPASSHKRTLDVAAVVEALPKPRQKPVPHRKQRAGGLADSIRTIVDAMPDKHEFKRAEVIKPLLEAGFSLDSISPGLNHALRSTRFSRLGPGHYRVVNPRIPITTGGGRGNQKNLRPPTQRGWGRDMKQPKPKLVTARVVGSSARQWLERYVSGMPVGSGVTRQQLMQAGEKVGHAATSMNTAIATVYTVGKYLTKHPHRKALYIVPSRPIRVTEAPSGTTPETITRHIEEV